MKDVAIKTLDFEDLREAAAFVDLVNTGEARFIPSLDADRDSLVAHFHTLLRMNGVPSPKLLRLYEGDGRVCGFLAATPRSEAPAYRSDYHSHMAAAQSAGESSPTGYGDPHRLVLGGPLLTVGDWAGHADALFNALVNELDESTNFLELDYYPANHNMRRFAERHGFREASAAESPFCTAVVTI